MENSTKTETCTNCNTQYRIPTDKHIIAICPKCGVKSEYQNGTKTPQKNKVNWKLITICCILLGLGAYLILPSSSPNPKQTNINPDKISIDTANVLSFDTIVESTSINNNIIKDSTKSLSDLLKDEAMDKAKDILEKILDDIKEKVKNGNWEAANQEFEKTTDIIKKNKNTGKKLLKIYESELAKLKIEILKESPNPNKLPSPERRDNAEIETKNATEFITNDTKYTLTLYYSGSSNFIVTIPPEQKKTISFTKGEYTIVAKISSPLVREYYDSQIYKGYSYNSSYYVTSSY